MTTLRRVRADRRGGTALPPWGVAGACLLLAATASVAVEKRGVTPVPITSAYEAQLPAPATGEPGVAVGGTLGQGRSVSGRVALPNGSAPTEPVTFYVQDLNRDPPTTAAVHSSAGAEYSFSLGAGRWRVIPVSPEYDFQPTYRDYEVGLERGIP